MMLSSFCFIGTTEASSTRDIQLYGPEQGAQLSEQSNLNINTLYTLNLGAFKNKQNALQYQARMQEQTGKTVHFVYQPAHSTAKCNTVQKVAIRKRESCKGANLKVADKQPGD